MMTMFNMLRTTFESGTHSEMVFELLQVSESLKLPDLQNVIIKRIVLPDQEISIGIRINANLSKLSDLVPLARNICDLIMDYSILLNRKQGKTVPCTKGCSTCCSYLVPLSIPEVIHFFEEVEAMPNDQASEVWEQTLFAARQLLSNGPSEQGSDEEILDALSHWYSNQKIECPFLKNKLCSIYNQRPLACREHLVTTPALWCMPDYVKQIERIELPLSMVEVLGQVTSELENLPVEAVMLPLALPWIQENPERRHRKWSSQKMLMRFWDVLDQAMTPA